MYSKIFTGLFCSLAIAFISSCQKESIEMDESSEEESEISPDDDNIFKVVEQMPRFPGCEDIQGSENDKKDCADQKMLEFIDMNIKYPTVARENEIEGNVIVRFIVEKDGSLTDAEVIRDLGAGTGEEALRLVNLMMDLPEKWTPGIQRGSPVRVQFILLVQFEL